MFDGISWVQKNVRFITRVMAFIALRRERVIEDGGDDERERDRDREKESDNIGRIL